MSYSLNPDPPCPIAFGPEGRPFYRLADLPDIPFPKFVRNERDCFIIDDCTFPYCNLDKKTLLWVQRMFRIWGQYQNDPENKAWVDQALASIVTRICEYRKMESWALTANRQF